MPFYLSLGEIYALQSAVKYSHIEANDAEKSPHVSHSINENQQLCVSIVVSNETK